MTADITLFCCILDDFTDGELYKNFEEEFDVKAK